ncbi:MAG: substrate-binding domain-containing protein [Pirellulales bacterium]
MKQRSPPDTRSANTTLLITGSVVVLVLIALLLTRLGRSRHDIAREKPLIVFCAAGIRPPVEELARQYQEEMGVPIQLQYGPSGTLESKIEVNPKGDLFIPAGVDPFILRCQEKGLVAETIPLARFRLVLAVNPESAHAVGSLDDLFQKEIGFSLANEQAAVGRQTRRLLEKTGDWSRVRDGAKVTKLTVNDVAQDIAMGTQVVAGFVWDSTARQFDLKIVDIPQLSDGESTITAGLLTGTADPAAALRFARYLASPEKGQPVFTRHHYQPLPGDPWAVEPEITLYSGGVNRMAIEETVRAFEKREGCMISVTFNGCGILVAQMKAGQQPDAYLACDVSFVQQVRDQFRDVVINVSQTDLVILVRPGNPKNIHSLADLGRDGLRVGLADERLSALGSLTKNLLEEVGLYDQVVRNRRTTSPTADFLVTQLTTSGQLDAVVVYQANCAHVGGQGEIVRIDHPHAHAIQPFAIHRKSRYPQLTGRFLKALTSDASRARFESVGFRWLNGAKTPRP